MTRIFEAETPVAPGTVRLRVHRSLRFVLPRRARDSGELDLPHDPTATVGHLVQSAGVPLTEVGELFVAGVLMSRHSRLQEQDRLDVGVRARPQPLDGPARFLLDVHLGTLARRLRLLGIDTAYDRYADDDHLVERAEGEDRVLLSRDRGLLMRQALRRAAFVRGQDPDDQLADVIARFQPPLLPWSLCLACGGKLAPVAKSQVIDQLEPGTLRTQQQFSRCPACGKVYWHGAHDASLQQVVRQIRQIRRG
ncbi:MAG: Mut7-C RNAse domain-containing protein [Actinomycetota bacterium]